MKMTSVKSSNIKAVGYDEETKVMRIDFKAGGTYDYTAVPKIEYLALMKSESKGKFFFKHILKKFAAKKLEK